MHVHLVRGPSSNADKHEGGGRQILDRHFKVVPSEISQKSDVYYKADF